MTVDQFLADVRDLVENPHGQDKSAVRLTIPATARLLRLVERYRKALMTVERSANYIQKGDPWEHGYRDVGGEIVGAVQDALAYSGEEKS